MARERKLDTGNIQNPQDQLLDKLRAMEVASGNREFKSELQKEELSTKIADELGKRFEILDAVNLFCEVAQRGGLELNLNLVADCITINYFKQYSYKDTVGLSAKNPNLSESLKELAYKAVNKGLYEDNIDCALELVVDKNQQQSLMCIVSPFLRAIIEEIKWLERDENSFLLKAREDFLIDESLIYPERSRRNMLGRLFETDELRKRKYQEKLAKTRKQFVDTLASVISPEMRRALINLPKTT